MGGAVATVDTFKVQAATFIVVLCARRSKMSVAPHIGKRVPLLGVGQSRPLLLRANLHDVATHGNASFSSSVLNSYIPPRVSGAWVATMARHLSP